MIRRKLLALLAVAALCATAAGPVAAQNPMGGGGNGNGMGAQKPMTNAQRQAAAIRVAKAKKQAGGKIAAAIPGTNTVTLGSTTAAAVPTGTSAALATPDYFGNVPNYANSPLPTSVSIQGDGNGAIYTATVDASTGSTTYGKVTGFTMVNQGAGYTAAATSVVVIGGGGSGATGTPTIDATTGSITSISVATPGSGYGTTPGIQKFVDALPQLGTTPNELGQYLPIAVPETRAAVGNAPAADYYEIAAVQYTQKMNSSLPATTLRGYVQISTAAVPGKQIPLKYPDGTPILNNAGAQVLAVDNPQYLGPIIIAQKDRPVRIKFDNYTPKGTGGNLFLPVDSTIMGAGMGPNGGAYSQNRATLHLHGGVTPWISDGTPDQWTSPASQTEQYPKGVSTGYVPDMWFDALGNDIPACDGLTTCDTTAHPGATTNPGPGSMTFYYTNQQSARLMFYHDHAYGITRLNVYAGEAAGYVLQDPVEQALVTAGTIPATQIPLVIEDKTFVPSTTQLAAEDPTWNVATYGGYGNLWFPHVYMPNQNPSDISGANPMGRWDYGQWFWPIFQTQTPTVPNPLCTTPGVQSTCPPGENAFNPGIPNPSIVPEGFMDTMTVNGTAYPYLTVGQQSIRFRILNASNDRTLNLSLYHAGADSSTGTYTPCNGAVWTGNTINASGCSGEVPMVPAVQGGVGTTGYTYPDQLDGRAGGVPDSRAKGPDMWQIGTEGGFLSHAVDLPNGPIGYNYNRRDIVVLNTSNRNLTLGPAERADVVVDFSGATPGDTYILYNDSPAPMPAFDTRYDYYTGDPDQVATGGAPTTLPGYGPNTRTVMQIQVTGTPLGTPTTTTFAALAAAIPTAYGQTQPAPVVPERGYDAAFGTSSPADPYARIQDMKGTFNTGTVTSLTVTNPGTGYTGTPSVLLSGGGGAGATAAATVGKQVASLLLTAPGSGYTGVPTVTLSGGGGTGATAAAALNPAAVAGFTLTAPGSGYTSAPTVALTGGGGSGATATATLATRGVAAITVVNQGSLYTTAPTVAISGGGGSGATATAALSATKVLKSVTINRGGRNYTSAPTITFTGGGGSGAAATAAVSGGAITAITVTNPGSGYTSAPSVAFSGGGGSQASATAVIAGTVASITVTNAGSGYTTVPTVALTGGGGSGATATATLATAAVASLTLTTPGSGYTSAPAVGFTGGGGSGAAATARLAPTSVASLTLVTPGTGFTTAPTVAITGGGGTGATGTATLTAAQITGLTITNPGSGYVSAPSVAITGGGGTGGAATAAITIAPVTVAFQPMGIQELFDPFYGRMNATMSMEIPNTNGTIQTTIPYGYIDPPTEIINTAASGALGGASPLAMLPDGTQIWKFTHNGVDTHSVHFHMFNIELINRVGWDGAIRPPDPNEMGWKDTVRMSPLEDAIVAIKPIVPNLPWPLPNSIRPLDVTAPLGDSGVQYTNVQPNGNPVTVVNHLVNFGWEYVFHCHLLGHEENDMMRPMLFGIAPLSPSIGTATPASNHKSVTTTFIDNSVNETGFTIQRSANGGATWTTVGTVARPAPVLNTATQVVTDAGVSVGGTVSFTDTTVVRGTAYLYRVIANDVIGDTQTAGFPSQSINSVPSAASASVTP